MVIVICDTYDDGNLDDGIVIYGDENVSMASTIYSCLRLTVTKRWLTSLQRLNNTIIKSFLSCLSPIKYLAGK